jgi:rhodanese-related sulfurtransferase
LGPPLRGLVDFLKGKFMFRTSVLGALLLSAQIASAQMQPASATAATAMPLQPPMCAACHTLKPDQMGGYFESAAFKSQSIQVDVGSGTPQVLRFNPKTLQVIDDSVAKTSEYLKSAPKRHEVIVDVAMVDGAKVITKINFKGPVKVDPALVVDYPDVLKLVQQGPEKGKYTLIDSRPMPRFEEGAIPTAIALPFTAFEKFVGRLPKDKSQLVVFYCGGLMCSLSPNSMFKAQKLGYTNVRVYREGLPQWQQRNYQVLSPKFLKGAYIDKDIPHVLIDARSAADAASGHIQGAVTLQAPLSKAALKMLPPATQKAPLIVYDGRGGDQAETLATALIKAGQKNVLVLSEGMIGWQAAGYAIVSDAPAATKIAYTPKPRAGSIAMDEFAKLARSTPSDVLILDVRNPDEAREGMIKGAMLLPDEEIAARIAELPKGKRILTHCATGVRAEMAYHKLKAAGFNAAFLNNEIEIGKDGSFKITPR